MRATATRAATLVAALVALNIGHRDTGVDERQSRGSGHAALIIRLCATAHRGKRARDPHP
ncbi:hypothetical protein ACFC08_33095 [Streptomyces sp. NPDC056112]|uniref:hypothetical protein n=1 Tax=unclassified Streptomyces TaxID=2593676 RepID=UPI001CD67DF0|nr:MULTISPECIES: hypothetical protein [unclassified Streptomyces]